MSCPEFVYTPHGRQGIGVIQPQSGLDYPFVKPSDDIKYLVADFYLAFDDRGEYTATVPKAVFPLRIKYLYNVGCEPSDVPPGGPLPSNSADIVIVDANDVTVLNTRTDTSTVRSSRPWGDDYRIYEWTTADSVCRLVAYTTWQTGEPAPVNYAQYLAPVAATLDARTVYKMPKRLRTISVRQRGGVTTTGPYAGKIKFRNNYNLEIATNDTTTTNFVTTTQLTFSAEPGTGAGYFPVCGSGYDEETQTPIPQPIKQINGVTANSAGNFFIPGNDCLYARRPTVVIGGDVLPHPTAQQQIGADCTPCCACTDYVNTALYMNQVSDRYRLIGQRVTEVKEIHEANIQNWLNKRACTLNNPLKLVMVPQCCPTMDVVMMLCNPCQVCYPASTLNLTLAPSIATTLSVVCGETTLYVAGGNSSQPASVVTPAAGGGVIVSMPLPAVAPGSSSYVKLKVKSSVRDTITLTGTLTGVFSDGTSILTGCAGETKQEDRQLARTVKTASFNCATDGANIRPC